MDQREPKPTEIELNQLDLQYENLRLSDHKVESQLQLSILECGIQKPIQGIWDDNKYNFIVLNGFKRIRAAMKLKLSLIPVETLADNEVDAFIFLIKQSQHGKLHALEEAAFLKALQEKHSLTVVDLSVKVEKSPAWVSLRLGLCDEMSAEVKDLILNDKFPVRNYMYTLRPFTRVNGFNKELVDTFVKNISQERFSTRDIDTLAYLYFRGKPDLRNQINNGKAKNVLSLFKRKELEKRLSNTGPKEQLDLVHHLELVQKYMNYTRRDIGQMVLTQAVCSQAAVVLMEGALATGKDFLNQLRRYYDTTVHS